MRNNINNNYSDIPFLVIDNSKNLVSYNLQGIDNINLILNKVPQPGQGVVDIFPHSQTSLVSEMIDKCLSGNTFMVDKSLVEQILKSPLKIQLLFISIRINVDFGCYAVCLFLPDHCQHPEIESSNESSRFNSHQLKSPISNILSLANFEKYSQLKFDYGLKTKDLLKDIHSQAEKLNSIITTLNDLVDPIENLEAFPVYRKLTGDHIVLVDDDLLINMMHKMILSKYKKKAIIKDFDNPTDALTYIYSNTPDLIFLDINMPEIDGWTFLQRLEEHSSELSVIIVTSSTDLSEKIKAHTYKCVKEFIEKPLTREKLDSLLIEFQ